MSKRPGYSSRHSVTPGQEGGKLREFQKGEEKREEEAYFVRANLLDIGINVTKKSVIVWEFLLVSSKKRLRKAAKRKRLFSISIVYKIKYFLPSNSREYRILLYYLF